MSQLFESARKWRDAAQASDTKFMREVCERTARALEIENETGIPVCSCCHKVLTVDDHGRNHD